jgi:hypothetical protein
VTLEVVEVVLVLRIAPQLWAKVSVRQPDFDRTVQRFMDGGVCWMFDQPHLEVDRKSGTASGRVRHVIETSNYEFLLEKPTVPGAEWDYDIVHLQPATSKEGAGAELRDEILVYKPENAPAKRDNVDPIVRQLTEPDRSGVRQEFAIVVKTARFKPLASYLKAPINLAWHRVRRGRTYQRVFWGDDVIFLLTVNRSEPNPSTVQDEQNLQDALESVDAGRIITDPYELKRIREMAAKFGDNPNESATPSE